MPIHYILANLIANNDGAIGALFLDDSGETVDFACADSSPYEVRIAGAYVGIYLKQLDRVTRGHGLGLPDLMHIERGELHIYSKVLQEGYYVVLLQKRPALVAQAQKTLRRAVAELQAEFF